MNDKERAQIEEYRRTLENLHKLYRRLRQQGAPYRQRRLVYSEIEEVTETLCHLLKGESRYKWHW